MDNPDWWAEEAKQMRLPEYCATHTLKEFMEMLGPDFHKDNTQQKPFDCRLETCVGKCDCEKIEQCKYSPEYYLRAHKKETTAAQIVSTEFPRAKANGWLDAADVLDGPEQEAIPLVDYRTNPVHGGKVTCHKCGDFILDEEFVGYLDHQHKDEFPKVHFHTDCYNVYEHYYGLDKPID